MPKCEPGESSYKECAVGLLVDVHEKELRSTLRVTRCKDLRVHVRQGIPMPGTLLSVLAVQALTLQC